jgi:hypothetical protein
MGDIGSKPTADIISTTTKGHRVMFTPHEKLALLKAEKADKVDVERFYRELYWDTNELQIIGTEACIVQAAKNDQAMAQLVDILGYTPAA